MTMKRKNNRGGRRGGGGNNNNHSNRDSSNSKDGPYNLDIATSESFDKYYKAQGLIEPEEWDAFMEVARSPLPMTFRITSSRDSSQAVNDHVKNEFVPHLSDVVFQGEKQSPPKVLEWYPAGLAWQLDSSKQVVRKSKEFARFQQFLVHETDSGNISRQEAVSMIPPLLLDVQPHHYVLDCCAAPGSKTVQLLEALHAKAPTSTAPADPIPSGLLIANDSDAKRCHMLVHQSLNRIGSPNCMITNLDASAIPSIKIPNPANGQTKALYFDRILCDVPCSGDGTTRKNPGVWKTWKPADGLGLHGLQVRILSRAIQMLKPGGRLVYSTCSYNPIENEAVVSAALAAFPNMSLVDVSDALPGLKRKQGISSWKVFDRQMNEIQSSDQQASGTNSKPIADTCWPNGREAEFHMERCLRLYPQLQNTGGFFVAVLEKEAKASSNGATSAAKSAAQHKGTGSEEASKATGTKRAPSPAAEIEQESKKVRTEEAATSTATPAESSTSTPAPDTEEAKMGAGRPFGEDPYCYLKPDDDQLKSCVDFFEFSPDFPSDKLFVRNADGNPLRSIYLSSDMVRTILDNNDYARLRLISCGVKILVRQDPGKTDTYKCRWRVTQDGLPVLKNYMGPGRKMQGTLKSLRRLCSELYPTLDGFEDPEFTEIVKNMDNGSLLCDFLPGDEAGGKLETAITLPLWRAPNSICLMVEKMEKRGLSMRIFGEDLSQRKGPPSKKSDNNAEASEGSKTNAAAETQKAGDINAVEQAEGAVQPEEAKVAEDTPQEA